MFEKIFNHHDPPLRDLIHTATRRLQVQKGNLELAATRLRNRDETLFETCARAISNGERERATIYAREIAEIKKIIYVVTQSQLSIEQVILRLETIKEIGDILQDLNPLLATVQGIAKRLNTIMPEVTLELNDMNSTIAQTLSTTTLDSTPPITPIEANVKGTEEILQEVSAFAEEMLKKRLPEPPKPVIQERVKSTEKVKQLVALTTGSPEATSRAEPLTEGYFSYKDVTSRRVSFIVQRSPLTEEKAIEDAEKTGGKGLEVLNARRKIKVAQ